MKKLWKVVLSIALVMSSLVTVTSVAKAAPSNTVYPNVQQYTKVDGKTFTLGQKSRIYVVANSASLNNEGLLNDLKLMSSNFQAAGVLDQAPTIVFGTKDNAIANDIIVELGPVAALEGKDESYQLEISDRIIVSAKDEIGIYYGLMSTIQLLKLNQNTLTQGTIVDYPDVAVRSMHIDIARKPITKDWIIRQIKDLSWQKYNSVQIHFSENEGFRLQSDTLDAIEGFRYAYDDVLSKQDMLDIIKVANDYHIEIIPSLDSPGHLGSVLRYLPSDYHCGSLFPQDDRRAQCFNIFTNPKARDFLVQLMTEFIEFFGDAGCKHFNIGGDEFLAQFSRFSNEQYAQIMNYFNDISKIVKENGMIPRAWNDGVLYGNYTGYTLDPDIEICYWAAPENCAPISKLVANGNKVINYSDAYMYYVLSPWWQQNAVPEGDRIYNEWHPGKFSALRTGQQTFKEPYPDYVLGGSYAIWCDLPYYETEQRMEEKLFYRTRATAYNMWNANDNKPAYNVFKATMDTLGRTPGFKQALPEPGEVIQGQDTATVTLKYVDNFGNNIIADEVVYGVKDTAYHFEAKSFVGYQFVDSDEPLEGTFNGNKTITLRYKLHCDKTELKEELMSPLPVDDYINETVADYKQALAAAQAVYDDETSTQLVVNDALKALRDARQKAIKLEYYPLYVEVMYPLEEGNYQSGYEAYKKACDDGKALLQSSDITVEKALAAWNVIQEAKEGLVKPSGLVPTIEATDRWYNNYNYGNMIDGNDGTKCWFNQNQEVGKEIKFNFASPVQLSAVQIKQPSDVGDDAIAGADVQISENGKDWATVGSIDGSSLDKTVTFDQTTVKHVRLVITKDKPNWYQISEVIFTMEVIPEDTTLKDLIDEAETLDVSGKTNASVNHMVEALINAKKALVSNKVDVTEEINQLRQAINDLKDKVATNKEALNTLVDEARKVENKGYAKEDWDAFEKALANAIQVQGNKDATQEAIDNAVNALTQAMDALTPVVDKSELKQIINDIHILDEKRYTKESWAVLMQALDQGTNVLEDQKATQDQVTAAVKGINEAREHLVLLPVDPPTPENPNPPTPDKPNPPTPDKPNPPTPSNPTPPQSQGGTQGQPPVNTGDHTSFMAMGAMVIAGVGIMMLRGKKKHDLIAK